MSTVSMNGKLILEPYVGGKNIKSEVRAGFSTIKRSQLVGLKVLSDALVIQGSGEILILKDSIVFISEEVLTLNDKYHNPMENAAIGVPFVLGDFAHVVIVQEVEKE